MAGENQEKTGEAEEFLSENNIRLNNKGINNMHLYCEGREGNDRNRKK